MVKGFSKKQIIKTIGREISKEVDYQGDHITIIFTYLIRIRT
jgi:hypothetical protein